MMENRNRKILAGLVIVAALYGVYWAGGSSIPTLIGLEDEAPAPAGEFGFEIGSRAPSFDLPLSSGGRLRSSDLYGIPHIIIFWATWNQASADMLKILDDYALSNPSQAGLVRIAAVNSQEDPALASTFVRRGGYATPVALDEFGEASDAYGVRSLPTIYFISREGTVSAVRAGAISEESLVKNVEELLK